MPGFQLKVWGAKAPNEYECGDTCRFLSKRWTGLPHRCLAFQKPLPVADGVPHRLPDCIKAEVKP